MTSIQAATSTNSDFAFKPVKDREDRLSSVKEAYKRVMGPLGGSRSMIKKMEQDKDLKARMLFYRDTALGFFCFSRKLTSKYKKSELPKCIKIKSLFIFNPQQHSRKGFGARLLSKIEEDAKEELHAESLVVRVKSTMVSAINFFTKNGFRRISEEEGKDQTELLLGKRLGNKTKSPADGLIPSGVGTPKQKADSAAGRVFNGTAQHILNVATSPLLLAQEAPLSAISFQASGSGSQLNLSSQVGIAMGGQRFFLTSNTLSMSTSMTSGTQTNTIVQTINNPQNMVSEQFMRTSSFGMPIQGITAPYSPISTGSVQGGFINFPTPPPTYTQSHPNLEPERKNLSEIMSGRSSKDDQSSSSKRPLSSDAERSASKRRKLEDGSYETLSAQNSFDDERDGKRSSESSSGTRVKTEEGRKRSSDRRDRSRSQSPERRRDRESYNSSSSSNYSRRENDTNRSNYSSHSSYSFSSRNGSSDSRQSVQRMERMPLKRQYLNLIASGEKTVEGRINSYPFKNLKIGTKINFFCTGSQDVTCEVIKVTEYRNFREMLEKEGVSACLGKAVRSLDDGVRIYDGIPGYQQKAAQNGVLGIKIKLLK